MKLNKQTNELDFRRFHRDGYLIKRQCLSAETVAQFNCIIEVMLNPLQGPAEYESDVGYPGSPSTRLSKGGKTSRRLLYAYSRHRLFRAWATCGLVHNWLQDLLHTDQIELSQSHHNCIMTKYPGHSSSTSWHQDNRYWSFDRQDLVSVWLALDDERAANGGMCLISGSHRSDIDRGQLDQNLFLRDDLHQNQALIDSATPAHLQAGDVMFFHSGIFHAAAKNLSSQVKKALVYTYHASDNCPIPGTRSALYPSISLSEIGLSNSYQGLF